MKLRSARRLQHVAITPPGQREITSLKKIDGLYYWTIGAFWVFICLGLGFYIRTRSAFKNKFTIGLLAIFVSYLCGVGMLVAALCM